MKEIEKIISTYDQLDLEKVKAALATVVRVEGSSYRREGARMLITSDGRWTGGISGGCLEGDALRRAQHAIFQQKPKVITYDTTGDDPFQIGVGLGCQGIIDVLIEALNPGDKMNPVELLRRCTQQASGSAIAVVTEGGSAVPAGVRLMLSGGEVTAADALPLACREAMTAAAHEALQAEHHVLGTVELAAGQTIHFFTELLRPPLHLLLFGSNYDVLPLVEIGNVLGWKCTVAGDLKKFEKAVFGRAKVLPKNTPVNEDALAAIGPASRMAVVLMSHDYATDLSNLKKLLPTTVPYIALLGPKKRTLRIIGDLAKEEITLSPADEFRLHGPAGLDIGATSPEGIALSIAAEIVAFFGGREGGFLKNRTGPIYEPTASAHAC